MSLYANRDFRRLWIAQAVSAFGARITREGLPIVAVLALGAEAAQVGVLAALSYGPALVVGLACGGLVDRSRRRGLMIAADIGRAIVLLALPAAALLGALSLPWLYVAAAVVGALSVLFEIADHAYLPSLVAREHLTRANASLSATEATAEVGGPALAGLLFQLLTAPFAIAVNAATYLASAVALLTIRKPEPPPRAEPGARWWNDVATGFATVWRDALIRPLLVMTGTNSLFGSFFAALYVLFALETVGLTPALLGLTITAGGLGALAGAALAPRLSERIGAGPAIVAAGLACAAANLAIPLAPAGPLLGTAALVFAQVVGDALAVAAAVLAASLRQSLLPQERLGRAGASFHAVGGGMAVLGALAGGLLGQVLGQRETLLIACAGLALGPALAAFGPLRRLRAA